MLKTLFLFFNLVAISWDQKIAECRVIHQKVVDVVDYGAVGDGIADDTQAFLDAWAAVCGSASSPPIHIPKRKTFLVKPVTFKGPCQSPTISFLLDGNIVAPDMASWTGDNKSKWIVFSHVEGLTITGYGTIDGQGSNWWKSNADAHQRPIGTVFQNCNNLQLQGFTHRNSASLHIYLSECNGVSISNLHVFAPESSPNTDGIDISRSSNVDISFIDVKTGDDCIAIGGGSSYINITSVSCGPGHGISIGSLGANGEVDTVEEVYVKNCTLVGTTNGARIKTWQGGSGFARRIWFNEITVTNVANPILIDQFYCPLGVCVNETSAVKVSDVSFIGFRGTSRTKDAITLKCSESIGCSNITLDDINIGPVVPGQVTQASCLNAHGRSGVTTPVIKCLSA